jgi:hypothetical protein
MRGPICVGSLKPGRYAVESLSGIGTGRGQPKGAL